MREALANLVFPVLNYGIRLKESLRTGRPIKEFQEAQKEVLGLLQQPAPAEVEAEFLGGGGGIMDSYRTVGASVGARMDSFWGIRYALACWLDEIIIEDTPWKNDWENHKIETQLFRTNDRASRFWDQMDKARTRPTRDALEAFYLCVMLGFRGNYYQNPEKLRDWRDATEAQITQGDDRSWEPPVEMKIQPHVPLLVGARKKQRMLLAWTVGILILIPIAVFMIFYRLK